MLAWLDHRRTTRKRRYEVESTRIARFESIMNRPVVLLEAHLSGALGERISYRRRLKRRERRNAMRFRAWIILRTSRWVPLNGVSSGRECGCHHPGRRASNLDARSDARSAALDRTVRKAGATRHPGLTLPRLIRLVNRRWRAISPRKTR